ncbi:MAG: hypothetical protein SFW36_14580 [Leptolyngbyaceae cyanobacterium bins.59]|nr:hypothetical protein [Leptolyngbyaceae cyanobacterium bins.59]
MTRQQKHPLRDLTAEEQQYLEKVSRSQSESVSRVVRAKILLLVAEGKNYTEAAHEVGRRCGDAVGKLVARFNGEGIKQMTHQLVYSPISTSSRTPNASGIRTAVE